MKKRRNHDAGFKARVALEAVKGERTVSELARLEAFQRAGFTDEFLEFHHLRMRIDLWFAACNSDVLADTERVLYDHYRQTLRELLMPLASPNPRTVESIPALLDTVMATQDGLWLDWLRRRDSVAVENGLRMCVVLVRSTLSY